MAKLNGPLLSLSVSGTVGEVLTFSERRTGSQTRYQRGQKDYVNPAREIARGFFQMAAGWWGELTATEQYQWHEYGQKDP